MVDTELLSHNTHPMVLEAAKKMPRGGRRASRLRGHRGGDPVRGRRPGARGRQRGARAARGPAAVRRWRMKAVTFQAPGEVRVDERPEPELLAPDDAIVQVEATGVCGSDLHIYHGRVKIEPGFVIGHEFVGEVIAAGDAVDEGGRRRPRARVLPHRLRVVLLLHARPVPQVRRGAGVRPRRDARLAPGRAGRAGARAAAQPHAAPRARRDVRRRALFAGDVMGTGYHAVVSGGVRARATRSWCWASGPSACAPRRRRGVGRGAGDRGRLGDERLSVAREFGAAGPPDRGGSARGGEGGDRGRGADLVVDAVGTRTCSTPPAAWRARRNRLGGRRLRGALRGAHGRRVDQGAHDPHRARERDRARRLGARHDAGRAARPDAARQPPHEARRGARRLRGLANREAAEDRDGP